ncbi:hypothetical protein K1T71_000348 [Dendrolimus kikuchii]|uniref:Uncharacterized protein n=1 Tax=Dendrolimus kikuchii TaxID=765133 RepID=A0ACC1DJF4_9NEOP|nr:hypothetical protein K1T71_000348 [Dendrolimus kikuchii]
MAPTADSLRTLSLWPNNQDDYELRDVIGVGSTSIVYSVYCKPKGEKFAIKIIDLEKWNMSMDELLNEIQAMSSFNHENIVPYYTSFVVNNELWLVLQLLGGGSLLDIIKHKLKVTNCKNGVFDEATIATVLQSILKALEYFHNNGQVHRDIKAANILLGEDGTVQVANFGISALLANGKDMCRQAVRYSFVGTPCWMAPEVMDQTGGHGFKADIWSFGITAIEMATGYAPYHMHSPMKVIMLTLQNDPPNLDTGAFEKDQYKVYGKTFRNMINSCLQKDPSKRPTATELLKHPFFKKAKDNKYLTQTLVAIGPSMETRIYKANTVQSNTWNYLHRTTYKEWVWNDDEKGIEMYRADRDSAEEASRPINIMERVDSTDEKVPDAGRTNNDLDISQRVEDGPRVFKIALRLRNTRRELKEIRFEFVMTKDTVQKTTSQLIEAGLVDPHDSVPIFMNLAKLLDAQIAHSIQTPPRSVTFYLNSSGPNEQFDDKALMGFAQILIVD